MTNDNESTDAEPSKEQTQVLETPKDEEDFVAGRFWPRVIKSAKMGGVSVNGIHVLLALRTLADFWEPTVYTRINIIRAYTALSKRSISRGLAELKEKGICIPVDSQMVEHNLGYTLMPGATSTAYLIQPYIPPIPDGEDYEAYGRLIWEAVKGYYEITHPYQFEVWLEELTFNRCGALDVTADGFLIVYNLDYDIHRAHWVQINRHLHRMEILACEFSGKTIQFVSERFETTPQLDYESDITD